MTTIENFILADNSYCNLKISNRRKMIPEGSRGTECNKLEKSAKPRSTRIAVDILIKKNVLQMT